MNHSKTKMAKKRASLPADDSDFSPSDTSPRKKVRKSRSKISPEVTDNTEEETPSKKNSRNRSYKSSPKSVSATDNEGDVTITEASLSLRFETPTNYKQIVHTAHPDTCKEELEDDDVELWLCKVPADMDIKILNGQKVNLCGSINVKQRKETKYKKTTELIFEKALGNQNPNPLTVLTMSKSDGRLHPVNKKIEGFLTLRELPVLEPYVLPPCKPREKKQIPEGLKQRYQPFGSDTPVISSVKHKKKKKKSKQH